MCTKLNDYCTQITIPIEQESSNINWWMEGCDEVREKNNL
jgi:hypothetical protein